MPADNRPLKTEWLAALQRTHQDLIQYVSLLPDEALLYSETGKWNAGQQLQHVYLCLLTISQALASRKYIEDSFGRIDRSCWNYDEVIERYKAGLSAGGKAPDRFVPGPFELVQKDQVIANLRQVLETIGTQLASYTEEECNTLVLPHPFVGKLTIRELFFLMTEHASLHQHSIEHALITANHPA
jgi:hypothetical protein